jgi:hypothetical protein
MGLFDIVKKGEKGAHAPSLSGEAGSLSCGAGRLPFILCVDRFGY